MSFAYKKREFEDIFAWAEDGNSKCFYCRDKEDAPLAVALVHGKGICHACLERFEIGHLGADRHVVDHIAPEFQSREEALRWFKQYGEVHFVDVVDEEQDDVYIYHFVNDPEKYRKYQEMLEEMRSKGHLVHLLDDREVEMSYNSLEIHKDGRYSIVS
ncbi:hypothetical protein [Ectobacillus ponti]|uniref:Uncharacterized protein n=1 Tax=Ectobacillus ponti TaxID=2961894 RepID=A0AA41X7H4_9BACI|nr:hypothetical protein [Ectobacillus ponti]MCP8970341.1 hypothetical protein [Ectobacillus ponti]